MICLYDHDNDNDNDNDNENMFITIDIYNIREANARHKYIGKSIKISFFDNVHGKGGMKP